MSVVVIGVNHRTSPIELLERFTLDDPTTDKALHGLEQRDDVREVAILSTCNRTEIYAITERFHGAYADIRDFLCELGQVGVDELAPHLELRHDDDAVHHVFSVASGLDSAVLGEHEILAQLKHAWERAREAGTSRSGLNLLLRHAIEVGKRVRTETAIGRGTSSVSHAAVEMAGEHLGGLEGRHVAVVGAGAMGAGIAVALHKVGAGRLTIVNRDPERGRALAERVGGRQVGFEALSEVVGDADVVLTGTASDEPILTAITLSDARRRAGTSDRPLLVVDIAVPRDVDPAAGSLEHVTLLDIDDLRGWADRGRQARLAEVERVQSIVRDEVGRFAIATTERQAAPLIASLRQHVEELRLAELERHAARLQGLDDDQRDLVDAITRGVLGKLLHEPSVRLRAQAGTAKGERNAAAVADLFDLG